MVHLLTEALLIGGRGTPRVDVCTPVGTYIVYQCLYADTGLDGGTVYRGGYIIRPDGSPVFNQWDAEEGGELVLRGWDATGDAVELARGPL